MNEDKRIIKTKQNLKTALLSLLEEKDFEQISVKEICERAKTSRITFYTHYTDKFELIDTVIQEYLALAVNEYSSLQEKNNPQRDPIQNFCNLQESILDLCLCSVPFLKNTFPSGGSYINNAFYHYLYKYVEHRVERESAYLNYKYSTERIASFLTYGFWGFVVSGRDSSESIEKIKKESRNLLLSILNNDVIANNNPRL